jgi:pSer/pThr/pTyr-binding forkhead associated (FHA) protein
MPKFTITSDGKTVAQTTVHDDRIEMGSAPTCLVRIDDLLISLKQAVFTKTPDGYSVEPVSRTPAISLNGVTVSGPTAVPGNAILRIEAYEVKIEYQPGELAQAADLAPAPAPRVTPAPQPAEIPLPPPLEPDLPPPLDSEPVAPTPVSAPSAPVAPSDIDKAETVIIRRVGRIVAQSGPLKGQHWDLRLGQLRIGRDATQNDVVVRLDAQGNPDNSISRRHALIHVTGKSVLVEDLGSAAGTFVNGVQVVPGSKVEVTSNDLIEIRSSKESTVVRVELNQPSAPPKEAPVPIPERPAAPPPPPAYAAAPRHEPAIDDLRHDEPIVRRRRRADEDENPFVPLDAPPRARRIPTWGWIVAGAGVLLLIVILILIAL